MARSITEHLALSFPLSPMLRFSTAGELLFGSGCLSELPLRLHREGWTRPLIVTDPHLEAAGIVKRVTQTLAGADIEPTVFTGGTREPSIETAQAAIAAARDIAPDVVIGVGGGSNLDLAKLVGVGLAYEPDPALYFGTDRVPGPIGPLVAIPTTSGTGSEVSHSAVLTDTATDMKVSTLSRYLRPTLAVVDPTLTLTCPTQATADSGIDALVHAVEAYLATTHDELVMPTGEPAPYCGQHPVGDIFAERTIELVGRHLRGAVADGGNLAHREGMALAATLAGMAFSNCGVALVHALEYPLGGALHVSHGGGNGLLLPHVMRFALPNRTARIAKIGRLLGIDTQGMTDADAAEAAIDEVVRLREEIGIPLTIKALGGSREQLPGFAAKSFAVKRLVRLTPWDVTEADCLAILEAAFE